MGFWAWLMGEEPGPLAQWLHSDDPGHFGEYLIEYALNSLPGNPKNLCNLYLPYKGRTSEIDVVMLHESGIYVFESKNYSGWIFGDEKGQYWTQCLNPKTKNRFYNPILQNKTHIAALQQYLKLPSSKAIISYIIFSERCELKKVCEKSENTFVVKRPDMLNSLRREMKKHPSLLSKEEINKMYEELLPLTNINQEEKEKHIKDIQEYKENKKKPVPAPPQPEPEPEPEPQESSQEKDPPILCPRCGSPMVLRTATKGTNQGKQFYGCSNFPKCRQIINLAE